MVRRGNVVTVIALAIATGTLALTPLSGASSRPGSTSHTTPAPISSYPTSAQVIAAVKAAQSLTTLPSNYSPSLATLSANGSWGGDMQDLSSCPLLSTNQSTFNVSDCYFGDTSAKFTVALVGDSRSRMLLDLFNDLGLLEKFRVLILAKSGCPAPLATYETSNNGTITTAPWPACTSFHTFILAQLAKVKPQLIVVSSNFGLYITKPTPHLATAAQVKTDFESFLSKLPKSSIKVVLGGFPQPEPTANPVTCLSRAPANIQTCGFKPSTAIAAQITASESATKAEKDTFLNQQPYFCATTCPSVVTTIIPYTADGYHGNKAYYSYLTGVIWGLLKPSMVKAKWS
jgi:hypothetical protein